MKKSKLAILMAVLLDVPVGGVEAMEIPSDGIKLSSGTESYISATDATITATGEKEGILINGGATADITIDEGRGTLTIEKSGFWAPVQINSNPYSTAQNNLTVNGNLVVNSQSANGYDSAGAITGIGDANLVVTGDLTVRGTSDSN